MNHNNQSAQHSMPRISARIVDLTLTPSTSDELVSYIRTHAKSNKHKLVANHNLHSSYLYHTSASFKSFYDRADVILIDGYPILRFANIGLRRPQQKLTHKHRVGSMDWVLDIGSQAGLERIALVGASVSSNKDAVTHLKSRNEGIEVVGWPGENWTPDRGESVLGELAQFKPDLVLVGLGMPLQESFIDTNYDRLPPAIYATVGGAIDQMSGHQRGAPRWLGRFGLEWLYRLITQPRRLGRRYLIEPWRLFAILLLKKFRDSKIHN